MENGITAEATKERTSVIAMITDIALLIPSIIVAFFTNFMLWLVLYRVRKGMGAHYDYGTGMMENLITVGA